jgi:hypothetical protein
MLLCDRPTIENWSPDFSSSEVPDPVWVRARCGEFELCNSLESVDWKSNPIQVKLCDACGTIGCGSGGYVHVSNVADLVFWTAPRADVSSLADGEYFPSASIKRFGSIAFPGNAWHQLRAAADEVPEQSRLPQADGRVIRDAWVMGRNRPRSTKELKSWLSAQLVAADSLDKGDALRWIEYWLLWFREMETTAIEGRYGRRMSGP